MIDLFLFAAPGSLWPTIAAGLFGLMIGSFLNVVIHRIPKMMQRESDNYVAQESGKELPHTDHYSLAVPRSACPHCGHQITALENIPIFSYLILLRGQCSNCKAPISIRYPLIEAFSGGLSALLIWHFGSGYVGLATLVFAYLLIAMTFIDFDTRFLPDDLTYPFLWCGLLINLQNSFTTLSDAVIGAVAGYSVLWGVSALYKLVRKEEGMGGGDFKLLAGLGAWFGWQALPAIILLSSLVGSVVGIIGIVLLGRNSKYQIQFGPYLAGAGFLTLFYGKSITSFIFTLMP
jgi:leader peptidase (prepilin peptidase) / N-methyltransferase